MRKLISLTGYRGFVSKLRRGEYLTLRTDRDIFIICSSQDFERFVYGTVDPDHIVGFFAETKAEKKTVEDNRLNNYRKDTVRRPVEQFVFSCIMQGISAGAYFS